MECFPDEILVHILSFLSLRDLGGILGFFPHLRSDEPMWAMVCRRELGYLSRLKHDNISWKRLGEIFLKMNLYYKDGSILIHLKNKPDPQMLHLIASIRIEMNDYLFPFVCIDGVFSYEDNITTNITGYSFHISDTGTYLGYYLDGKKSGHGNMRFRNGDVYIGLWENDQFSGVGEYKFERGELMRGYFKDGNLNGYGEYYWSEESYYKGNWVNDLWEGEGLRVWPNGMVYDGNFLNDHRDGPGTFYWPNQDKYVGTWRNGSRVGPGVLYLSNNYKEGMYQEWDGTENRNYEMAIPFKAE